MGMSSFFRSCVIVALFFSVGFAVRHFFGSAEAVRETSIEASSPAMGETDSARSTDAEETTSEATRIPDNKQWFQVDYRGNWEELFNLLLGVSTHDKDFGGLLGNLNSLSTSDKVDLLNSAFVFENKGQIRDFINIMYTQLARSDPSAAVTLFESMSIADRMEYDQTLVRGWARSDAKSAWEWLHSLDREGLGSYLDRRQLTSLSRSILSGLARDSEGVVAALELAQSVEEMKTQDMLVSSVVRQMARNDLDAAVAMIQESADLDSVVVESVIDAWAFKNAHEAAAFLMSSPDVATPRSASSVSRNLLRNDNIDRFMELYDSFASQDLKEPMASQAVARFAGEDLDMAIDWVNTIDNGLTKARAGFSALRSMGFTDNMDDHMRFIEEGFVGGGAGKRNLYVYSLSEWRKVAPEAVEEYVRNIPDDDYNMREKVVERLGMEESTQTQRD